MKENILDQKIEIKVLEFIKLLSLPVAFHMKNIQSKENDGYSPGDITPLNKDNLFKYIDLAFDGFIADDLSIDLRLKDIGRSYLALTRDLLYSTYQNKLHLTGSDRHDK